MPIHSILTRRVETYTREVEILAPSRSEAVRRILTEFAKKGWQGVFPDNEDGDLEDCVSGIAADDPPPVVDGKFVCPVCATSTMLYVETVLHALEIGAITAQAITLRPEPGATASGSEGLLECQTCQCQFRLPDLQVEIEDESDA